jgi:hypothetical protein
MTTLDDGSRQTVSLDDSIRKQMTVLDDRSEFLLAGKTDRSAVLEYS